jgi:predicted nucleotidyltransferase
MDIDDIKKVLRAWAQTQPLVKRAFIFGSRARGDFRSDSDLDVAIEIHLGADDSNILSTWIFEEDEMKENLQKLIPFKLQLELLDGQNTPRIFNAVKESGIIVYGDSSD